LRGHCTRLRELGRNLFLCVLFPVAHDVHQLGPIRFLQTKLASITRRTNPAELSRPSFQQHAVLPPLDTLALLSTLYILTTLLSTLLSSPRIT
jgi:hypothetical protein